MAIANFSSWKALEQHAQLMRKLEIRNLFAKDAKRGDKFSVECCGLFLDYSKNLIRKDTIEKLLALAKESNVETLRDEMFAGKKINTTENRAVLHTALRSQETSPLLVDGKDVRVEVTQVLAQMKAFSAEIRSSKYKGYTNKAITDIINIGIGGSDLGPKMICKALKNRQKSTLKLHFMSNVDSVHFFEIMEGLSPETTLFIITSKTFTTQETMLNASSAKAWFLESGATSQDIKKHFVGVTEQEHLAKDFGIETIFAIWDWVGGRYSLWSAVGLVVMISVGYDEFRALLDGAYAMDEHFLKMPLEQNMPVVLAVLSIWYNNFLGSESHAILPYDEQLRFLPPYLEQVDMESNGKSVNKQGEPVGQSTGSIIWGAQGINGQHAFYQLLHQSERIIPTDFIVSINNSQPLGEHHDILVANFIAQTEALMQGRTHQETKESLKKTNSQYDDIKDSISHRVFNGNKPSNAIMMDQLDASTLGSLIALYEHKVFIQGAIWGINSYDQWGVELGKQLASQVLSELKEESGVHKHDSSTNRLIQRYKKHKK